MYIYMEACNSLKSNQVEPEYNQKSYSSIDRSESTCEQWWCSQHADPKPEAKKTEMHISGDNVLGR